MKKNKLTCGGIINPPNNEIINQNLVVVEEISENDQHINIVEQDAIDVKLEKPSKTVDTVNVPRVHIPKETIERLLKDIKDMVSSSLESDGIFYMHSETDILKAYVMIIGQPGTLYFGGYYFFMIDFPVDYPYSPPVFTYLTNDTFTRFHPNFYKMGKVCLSMLNTWRGEQWTSCLTIKSVLLTLSSIMDSTPMLHEPGVTEAHADYNNYHTIILYKNIDFACIKLMTDFMNTNVIAFDMVYKEYFYSKMVDAFKKNVHAIIEVVKKAIKKNISKLYKVTSIYGMSCLVNFDELLVKVIQEAKKYNIEI
jgi:ubiquitin-conjugating enzyme E2 Z